MARHVVVVGGGLAGLASAVWLAEAGERVTLLERRGSLGGRTHAMPLEHLDDVPDNGQHVFASGYEHLIRYLESVGTAQHVRWPKAMGLRMPGGEFRSAGFTGLDGIRAGTADYPGIGTVDRLRAIRAQARIVRDALRAPAYLDDITAVEWFDRVGLPEPARRGLWNGLVIGLTGDKPEQTSARVPAELLATGARQAVKLRRPVSIGYPTVDLDTLYIDGAKRVFAQRGVTVRHRAVVRSVDVEAGRVTGVTLDGGEHVPADAVICAVPVWNIRGMLDQVLGHEQIYRAADHLTPVPIVSVNLYLDRSIGMREWGEILYDGEGVLEQVWDRQVMADRSTERAWFYSTTVSAAYDLVGKTNTEITDIQMDMLRRYYPAARDAQVVYSHIVRMPRSTFAQRPGTRGVRPAHATAVRRLALAGDWTRTDWSTTMEGAAQSAALAVEHILSQPVRGSANATAGAS